MNLLFSTIAFIGGLDGAISFGNPPDYPDLLNRQGTGEVVRHVLAAYEGPGAAAEIQQLANALSASGEDAASVLQALLAQDSLEGATISAELLYRLAQLVGGRRMIDDPIWQGIAAIGGRLLDHEDPFVRGIAAWGLVVVRDAIPREPIGPASPSWLAKCSLLQPESSLECEFVLQALSRGTHRTTRDLIGSAEDMADRAEALAAQAALHARPEQNGRLQDCRDKLKSLRKDLLDQHTTIDLASQRKLWLEVRRAVRDVVLSGPDMNFRELAFFQSHVRTEGNHPDCLVQNHDRPKERPPGGDIYIKSGFEPTDCLRPLIAGQLGPGHVQDMDLWWNADRLVFAYVRQPRWGDKASAWGSVAWRNGPETIVMDHVVGFQDGVFWENGSEPTHLFEIRTDGTGLRQLTDDPLYCDREPAYLPNGDVVFSSDRGGGASQCGAAPLAYSDFGLPNLFRVSADGRQVQRLTYNKDVDRYPHCLDNGLIGYMRWDYQERFWQWPHSLWTIRPDGTMNDGLFKVHFQDPQSVREPRSVPESQKLVVIACGHHSPPEGAVALVDPSLGINEPLGLNYITPQCSPLEGGLGSSPTVAEGGVPDSGGLYRTPWPLSETGFLVSYAYPGAACSSYAAYYIDVWGNKELIHRDRVMDVVCPMPIRPRPIPPMLPSQVDPQCHHAVCYLDDVNRDMPGVEPGTIRYIRISEQVQWYFSKHDNSGPIRWTPGTQHSRNFSYWSWSPTRVIGTVPVEEDGSAYFQVPTGLALSFQALDANRMEVRRMRSHVEFQPGEIRGCVGCHESKQHVPRSSDVGSKLAIRRPPSLPQPPPWGDVEILDYETLIQPIFDRQCVRCHGAEPEQKLDLSAARDPHGFMQSYRSLFGLAKDVPTPLGEGYREAYPDLPLLQGAESALFESVKASVYNAAGLLCLSNHMSGPEVTQPKQFGSHRSRLILTLLEDETHQKELALSGDEWETLVTWVDANAPYHGTFFQYFDAQGNALPSAIRVRIELDPPFQPGEKAFRVAGATGG